MIELLIIGITSLICGLVVAMIVETKRQEHKRRERVREYIKSHNRTLRLSRWKRVAIEWKTERNKPVKVQFT